MRRGASGINCLLAIDKPLGLTSHDVVGRVRRVLGERRVGHAGTLDPLATGVLVVGVGQATRLLGLLTLDEKSYEARIAFGAETSTDDSEGEVLRRVDVPERLREPAVAAAVVKSLEGTTEQVPPAFSAISVDGRRAYDRARSGEDVELPSRTITVHEANLQAVVEGEDGALIWECAFRVSKGTYIRSIARDLGRSMGTAAHIVGLRRTSSGSMGLDQSVTIEQLEELGSCGISQVALDPVASLGTAWHQLNDFEERAVAVGRPFSCREVTMPDGTTVPPREGMMVCLVDDDALKGVWQVRDGRLRSVATFPEGVSGVRHP